MGPLIRIKICGVRTPEAARAAVEAGADFIGLVFVPGSPRRVSEDEASAVSEASGMRAGIVGVFRDESAEEIDRLVRQVPLTRVQLHGASHAHAAALAPRPVTLALPFDDRAEAMLTRTDTPDNVAAFLIDTPDPTGLGGGTGRALDWAALRQLLDRIQIAIPIILAGGLTPDNVGQAIRTVSPWGVDVSGGVESTRGVKDTEKIAAFCRAARAASGHA